MTLAPAQVSTLRELQEIWSDRSVVIIGATALGFYHDMRWRQTADVDLLVTVEFDELGSVERRPRLWYWKACFVGQP